MEFVSLLIPFACLFRILLVEALKMSELHSVARRDIEISAVYAVLHLTEPVEHIARHIESQHGSEDDIHQVYHPLPR